MIYKSTFSFVIVVAIRVFSGVRIRGVRQFAGVSEKRTTSRVWGNDFIELNTLRIIRKCFKKWKSKTLYRLLMLQYSKYVEDLFDFSLQVHFNNEKIVHQISSDEHIKFVSLDDVTKNTTLDDIIENWTLTPMRIPLNLQHTSLYSSETEREIPTKKKRKCKAQENGDVVLESEKEGRISETKDIARQDVCDDTTDSQRARSVSLLTNSQYIGHCSQGEINVHDQRIEEMKAKEMCNDTNEYGEDSCAKVFMQLMCPSCCKGIFSETKGSVYMKRKSTLKSETKSVTMTICSEVDDGVRSVTYVEADATGASSTNRTHSPIPEETEDKNTERESEPMVFTAPKNESKPKLVRDRTFEEEVNATDTHGVLQKHRSMSLSETISNNIQEELSQNLQPDDDTANAKWYNNKLRKTSFPNSNRNGHPREDQKVGLKIGGKEYVEIEKQENEDEPPFNFQAVLRKTNTTRQSLRRSSDLSGKQHFEHDDFVAELLPGIVLKGIAYDL